MNKNLQTASSEELIYGFPKSIHVLAERYISRDILKCESSLISALIDEGSNNGDNNSALSQFTYEHVENIYYISPAWIKELSQDEQEILKKYKFRTMEDLADFMEDVSEVDSDGNLVDVLEEDLSILEDIHHVWKYRDSEA